MAKRLHVILQDLEYREIQKAARSQDLSLAQSVAVRCSRPVVSSQKVAVPKKPEAIRLATQHEYPTGEMDQIHR